MPQASNNFFMSEEVSDGGIPLGDGAAARASLQGSTMTISLPPRMTNWSMAYSALSDRPRAEATSRTWMSGSIPGALAGTIRTSLVWRSSTVTAQGWGSGAWLMKRGGSPSSGREEMTPTTVRFGFDRS